MLELRNLDRVSELRACIAYRTYSIEKEGPTLMHDASTCMQSTLHLIVSYAHCTLAMAQIANLQFLVHMHVAGV